MISRREFIAATGAAVTVSSVAGATLPESTPGGVALSKSASAAPAEKSSRRLLPGDDLKPATYDRLSLEWHKQRAKLLQEKLAQDGFDGILLTDRWNIIYFTGLWHTSTERLFTVFLPVKDGDPIWFYPGLDRDL